MRRLGAHVAWFVSGALIATVILFGVRAQQSCEASPGPGAASLTSAAITAPQLDNMADVAEAAVKSVVNISSEKVVRNTRQQLPFFNDPFFRQFFGNPGNSMPRERREKSLGSGVIVSKDGLVLTNNHVVDGADNIQVTLANGQEVKAKVVGTDPKSDVGVLRLEGKVKGLKPIALGDDSELRLGDVVLAIGNPFGVGQTVTMGIVSATGRANVGIVDYEDFIQTDAAINPGNSGGALVNMKGQLVGINTAILSRSGGYQGIGFAIPTTMAQGIMNSLIKHGKVVRGWLGVSIQDIDEELVEALKLRNNKGVLISDVMDDSPAQKAGAKRGDVILKVDGAAMDSTGKLRSTIAARGAKTSVKLEILREGTKKTLTVVLGVLPDNLGGGGAIESNEGVLGGLHLGDLNGATRQKYQIPNQVRQGVVVVGVERGSAAASAGFREGDVIVEFNRKKVTSSRKFSDMYKGARGKILVLVSRGGTTLYLVARKDK